MRDGRRIVIFAMVCLAVYINSVESFLFHDDEMSASDQTIAGNMEEEQSVQKSKRIPNFSINGGLRSLTDVLYKGRDNSGIRNTLLKIGKRWQTTDGDIVDLDSEMESDRDDSFEVPLSKRRSQLSVSGPLSALANMLAAEGRQRQFSESMSNRMRLLEIGKRSADSMPAIRPPTGMLPESALEKPSR